MKKIIFIIIFGLFLCTSLLAKVKKERCGGTYSYSYSTAISYDVAKAKAIEYAVVNALSDKFGTIVNSQSMLEMTNRGERLDQMSRMLVKGKFLNHIKEPEVSTPMFADNMFTVQVTVDFYAQPIDYAPTEFTAKLLKNGTDDRNESNEYVAGDYFYLSFRSPKAGYVAVFFEDATTVSCMLPYYEDDDSPFLVEKNKRYVFFNKANDEYYFSCGEEPEINYVHVIFSPKPFINGDIVREMTSGKFREWLMKRQSYDEEMQVVSMMVKVSPKKENW